MNTVRAPPPTLTVLTVPSSASQDAEMREAEASGSNTSATTPTMSDGERSPKSRNALGLTLPGSGAGSLFAHSIDAMLGGRAGGGGCSPPRRIIHEASVATATTTTTTAPMNTLKTPPLICEQGPSAPSSPTTPSPASRSAKRPCPLSVDALQRLNLLSPNYVPPSQTGMDPGARLPPVSPGYPTSDLGSSPRSSISASHYSALGINAANWTAFRDAYARRQGGGSVSGGATASGDLLDCESESGGNGKSGFLTPHQLLSPAPFSPFSDYGVADLHSHATSASVTPYSSRSPNLSPSPMRRFGGGNLHFSFEQIRSRSSLSNPAGTSAPDASGCHLQIPQPRSLDLEARERSRSEGEALAGRQCPRRTEGAEEEDERMDTGHPLMVTASKTNSEQLHAGQKRRLLHKSRRAEEEEEGGERSPQHKAATTQESMASASTQVSRQPTIEEPPPSPTLAELFQPGDLDKERRRQVEEWIRQQTAALEAFRHSLVPPQQETNLLQVPSVMPQNSLEQLWPSGGGASTEQASASAGGGPMRPATLWRRSRSESDVSAATAAAVAASGKTATASDQRRASHQHQRQHPAAPQLMVPLNEATHVCEHCGQGFSMHDRLAKHIASRHRDRSASMNDENSRVHKCTLCPKSFGRSDMLTRHMRLHTGLRPYACHLCGQVFSRSDHLSTHQRTHTGEKPYRCPQCNYSASRRDMITRHMRTHLLPDGTPAPFTEIQIPPINELTLNPQPPPPVPPPAPPSSANASGGVTPIAQVATPRVGSPVPHPDAPATTSEVAMSAERQEEEERQRNRQRMEMNMMAAAKLLSAAVANGQQQPLQRPPLGPCLEGLLNPQMVMSTLQAQLPAHLRRSSPNLLLGDYHHPSAFRPPHPQLVAATSAVPAPPGSAHLDQLQSALSALSSVQQLLQQQQQHQPPQQNTATQQPNNNNTRLSLPGATAAATTQLPPFLFRQNSFGGLGFADQSQPRTGPG